MNSPGAGAWAALRVPAYRRIWSAVVVQYVGMWMQITGRAYLVYEITGSITALGLIYLASYGPQIFVAPWAGVAADRYDRRQIVILATLGVGAVTMLTAGLTFTDTATLSALVAVSLALGVLNTFATTATQALQPALVPKSLLTSAVSLQSMTNNGARVVGPLAAGALIPILGVGWLFVLHGLSLVPVIVAWGRTRTPVREPIDSDVRALGAVLEGLREIRSTRALSVPIALLAVVSAVGFVYQPLGLAYATDVLARGDAADGARAFGLLQGAIGGGAFLGVLLLAPSAARHPAMVLIGTGTVFSLALAGLGATSALVPAVVLGLVVGAAHVANGNVTMSLAQHHAPEAVRGRVMATTQVAWSGLFPFTSFGLAYVADVAGLRWTFIGCALICLLASLAVIPLRRHIVMPSPHPAETAEEALRSATTP